MANVRLTTTNNPWNPFTDYSEWYAFDDEHEYGSSELLARVLKIGPDLTDEEEEMLTEEAIDTIVSWGIPLSDGAFYKKIRRDSNEEQKAS